MIVCLYRTCWIFVVAHTYFTLNFRFVKSADKVFKRAEQENLLGDEERAYVFYMKFFNLVSAIKKTAEYKKNEVGQILKWYFRNQI